MSTHQDQNSITLYLTEARAHRAAETIKPPKDTTWNHQARHTYEIMPATLRDRDGTTDHGFKVSIKRDGEHRYWL